MDIIKDFLFNTLIVIGLIAIIIVFLYLICVLLNRIFHFYKYLIMYQEYKKNKSLYDLKDKVIVQKDGNISYSCVGDLQEQIDILNRGIEHLMKIKKLREKYSKGD